ncbi:hypothetical protein DERF_009797, partial [Dermatophagoides farinae]
MDIDCPMQLRQKSRDIPCVVLAERKQGLKSEKLFVVLKPLVDELKFLSEYGIFLEQFNINVPVKLAFIIGDNLAVAELLGFRQTFGKNFICRYCKSTYAQIRTKLKANYKLYIAGKCCPLGIGKIKGNKNYKSQYGIKFESPFLSVPINIFQISPPDIFHDFVEGTVGDIIKIIIKKTKVGRENLKRKMAIKYVNDKISFGNKEQIIGKAAQLFFTKSIVFNISFKYISMMALLNQFYCKYPTTVNKSNTISNRNYLLSSSSSSSYMFNLIILIIVCIATPIINASDHCNNELIHSNFVEKRIRITSSSDISKDKSVYSTILHGSSLGRQYNISAIGTQGRQNTLEFVQEFKLESGIDGHDYNIYKDESDDCTGGNHMGWSSYKIFRQIHEIA